jgi:hypothetical protein
MQFPTQRINKGEKSMDTRKQNVVKEPKETASAASKMATGREQSSNRPSAPANMGTSSNQGTSLNQGGARENTAGDQDLLQHAKEATGEIVSQMQQQAGSQLTRQREATATDLSSVVDAVRHFGERLGAQENGPIARYVGEYGDKAAASLERLSTYIREQDPKQLLGDVQNFGRRRPALLLGGAFLLGFAGARLIKSSMDPGSELSFQPNISAPRPSTTPNAL